MKADQLSHTAAFLAIKFYGLTRQAVYRKPFDSWVISFYENVVGSLPAPLRYYQFWLKFRWVRRLYIWMEELLLPGDLLHVLARKKYIQQMTDQLLSQGYEQIIVLGAGFDHLALYYSRRGMACFETDTPRMVQFKRRFFNRQYPRINHPGLIEAHLPNDRIGPLLSEHPEIDPSKKTIVIAEGFFDYLPPNTVNSLLYQLTDFFEYKPALISTHFALNELPAFHRRVYSFSVRAVGEKLQLDTSMQEFEKLLARRDFKIQQLYNNHHITGNLQKEINSPLPVLEGFYVLLAS